ncbi:3-oxoacyl-[acyl-carrier-protein] reductase [Primorskyibacter sedentarius]|uniref:3-oxoacyl-[acyl-carrier-protein] reductase n=1 Tax=Primorskyibacter sedentarius TaxID=745311 RepID=A0A4R3JD63_9RHOB|nr:acetoacetyl-CoA reductase [Primorskyibacter sedentarius]TCS63335.1 3-oxoacyl-[acyl-carrier-protein] reductase [Primorskyibacter sedentarius]
MTRIALVTGGTRGLGAAASKALKAQGCKVAAVYHGNTEAADAFTAETGISTFKWDVSDFEACRDGVAKVEEQLGPIDILVNNAGITRDATLHHMSAEQWSAVINTNLGSVFNMCRSVVPGMRDRSFGRIVNVSSINGLKGQFGQTNYSAAKAGIIGFSKALALETAAKGITVNAVAPGYCDTDMVAAVPDDILKQIVAATPVGRLGRPADIARAIAFLASDDADFITGATLSVNGGEYMA